MFKSHRFSENPACPSEAHLPLAQGQGAVQSRKLALVGPGHCKPVREILHFLSFTCFLWPGQSYQRLWLHKSTHPLNQAFVHNLNTCGGTVKDIYTENSQIFILFLNAVCIPTPVFVWTALMCQLSDPAWPKLEVPPQPTLLWPPV